MFITKYNPKAPNIKHILSKHKQTLENDPIARKIFPPSSIKMVFKRHPNLKELLIRSDPYTIRPKEISNPGGTTHCGLKCDACTFLIHSTSFVCFATGRRFHIRNQITYITPNVIYLCTCKNCGLQGVGSTTKWKPRMANYKSHAEHLVNSCSISKHFNSICKSRPDSSAFLSFQIIDCLNNIDGLAPEDIEDLLLQKEKHWISTLVTMHRGMNSSHDWNRKNRRDVDDSL